LNDQQYLEDYFYECAPPSFEAVKKGDLVRVLVDGKEVVGKAISYHKTERSWEVDLPAGNFVIANASNVVRVYKRKQPPRRSAIEVVRHVAGDFLGSALFVVALALLFGLVMIPIAFLGYLGTIVGQ
jgi:hypothetical protein